MKPEKVKELNKYEKPIQARPNLYAVYFELLKPIAKEFGYNALLHGSLNRDMDIVCVPWINEPKDECLMLQAFDMCINGTYKTSSNGSIADAYHFSVLPGGRNSYYIDVYRISEVFGWDDRQYYIDISITPLVIK